MRCYADIHCASFDAWVRDLGHHQVPALSPRCIWHMGTTQDLEDTIYSPCQMRKSEEPLVVYRSLTWWLIDVCGSSAILLTVHLTRTTVEPLQHVFDKYRPTGSDQQEDLATLGSVQLRQTLDLWTAWRKATTRDEWRHIVDTATLQQSTLWKKKKKNATQQEVCSTSVVLWL